MYNIKKNILCTISVILIFIAFLFFPLFRFLTKINIDDLQELVKLKLFHEAVVNSIASSFISTVISILLAILSALCIERSKIKFKNIFSFVFIIPMLIPSISHSFGLAAIFGSNGIFTKIFGINIGIYGLKGIILGSIMYSFPVAFIMFKNILQYEDGSQYNVCKIFGINKWHQFFDITLPYLKRTFILAFFSVFTMVLTDYGVPLLIGAKTITLPVLMYNKTVAMIDYNTGSSISLFLLIPAIIAFFVDSILRDNKNAKYNTEKVVNDKNFVFDCISYMVCIFISICAVLPIIVFLIMVFETTYPINTHFTLNHIIKTIDRGALKYLNNSIIIAFFTGLFGTIFSFVCSYLTSRINNKSNKIVHICSILSMAVPGIIIGFSYIIAFKNSFLYGTMIILFVVNIFHFISSPYLMMYNSLNKINTNLELVGKTLGVSRFYIIKDVIIPKVIPTIIEMFSYFFVNAMMTISAVSFLCPPAPKPVSLMINQFEAQLLMESAAFISLLILLVNLIVKLVFDFLSYKYKNLN